MNCYPDFETVIESPNKSRLLELRRAVRSNLLLVVLFVFSVIGVYIITYISETSPLVKFIPTFISPSPRWLSIVPAGILLEIIRRQYDDLYIFGLHRITHLRGRLSLSYNIPVVKYADIRAINVSQSFWGRVLDYGEVSIGTAAHEGNELLITGIRAPEELALLLDKLRSNSIDLQSAEAQAIETAGGD